MNGAIVPPCDEMPSKCAGLLSVDVCTCHLNLVAIVQCIQELISNLNLSLTLNFCSNIYNNPSISCQNISSRNKNVLKGKERNTSYLINLNVCIRFHVYPSNGFGDILVWIKVVD